LAAVKVTAVFTVDNDNTGLHHNDVSQNDVVFFTAKNGKKNGFQLRQ
jgi:hypothetical protein